MNAKDKKQRGLVDRLRSSLVLTMILFVGMLILCLAAGIYSSINQYNLGEQKVTIYDDIDGILNSVLDQSSTLRTYINTDNPASLGPFNSSHSQYLTFVQHLKSQTNSGDFRVTPVAIELVEERADNWYNNYAQLEIRNMQSGNFAAARSSDTITLSRNLFNNFRASTQQLQQAVNQDLLRIQARQNWINWLAAICAFILSIIVIVISVRTFNRFVGNLHRQLDALKQITQRFGAGDLSARVQRLAHQELDQLGQTFNAMANALNQQQNALAERLKSILQLNAALTNSLDTKALTDEFLSMVLNLLDLQLGALYLYDPEHKQLKLFAARGLYQSEMEPEFRLGDGIIGRAALSREPIHLRSPERDKAGNFQIRTVVGSVLPASLYDMPLIRGDELFGVLAVGSVYPMSEKAQNVLNVVVSTLSTMLSNTRAYQHIQDQAQELAARSHEQELLNDELRQQRDELTSLNSALAEANRARSQFLSTMSHELRTPLASIILSRLFTDDDQREEIIPALIRKAATTFQLSYKLGANYLFSYWQLHRCACCADGWYVLWRIGSC